MKYCCIWLLFTSLTFAQKPPIKWGKVPTPDLKLEYPALEADAPAEILADYGEAGFNKYQELEFERHVRIKILNEEGLKYATVAIPFRWYQDTKEKITYLKASTYKLKGDVPIKVKMDPKDAVEEPLDFQRKQLRFTLPEVEVGSVIEYRYKYTTNPEWFPPWHFQNEIPTRHSEFRATFPEAYRYVDVSQGQSTFAAHDVKNVNIPFIEKKSVENVKTNAVSHRETTRTTNIQMPGTYHRWVQKEVASIKAEPYSAAAENFRPKVLFQLAEIRWPDQTPITYQGSWKDLREKLMLDGQIGAQLSRDTGTVNKYAQQWASSAGEPNETIMAIYEGLAQNVRWNGERGIRAEHDLGSVLEKGSGNAAEMGLVLVSLLRAAGVEAYPVLTSTRDHGAVQSLFPIKEQFNHILAMAQIGEMGYLLDATDPLRPAGLLPIEAMNGDGWLFDMKMDGWVGLQNHQEMSRITYTASMDEDGSIMGQLTCRNNGYEAWEQRKRLQASSGEPDWLRRELAATVSNSEVENGQELNQDLIRRHQVQYEAQKEGDGYQIYPIITNAFTEQLFPDQERQRPIDFIYPREWQYVATIVIPEGYQVAAPPEPKAISAPDQALVFKHNTVVHGQQITLNSVVKINHTRFEKDSYQGLQQFFGLVSQTLKAPIRIVKN